MDFPDIDSEKYLAKVCARRKVGGSEVGVAITVGDDKRIYLRTVDVGGTAPAVCRLTVEQAREISGALLKAVEKSTGDWFSI